MSAERLWLWFAFASLRVWNDRRNPGWRYGLNRWWQT